MIARLENRQYFCYQKIIDKNDKIDLTLILLFGRVEFPGKIPEPGKRMRILTCQLQEINDHSIKKSTSFFIIRKLWKKSTEIFLFGRVEFLAMVQNLKKNTDFYRYDHNLSRTMVKYCDIGI